MPQTRSVLGGVGDDDVDTDPENRIGHTTARPRARKGSRATLADHVPVGASAPRDRSRNAATVEQWRPFRNSVCETSNVCRLRQCAAVDGGDGGDWRRDNGADVITPGDNRAPLVVVFTRNSAAKIDRRSSRVAGSVRSESRRPPILAQNITTRYDTSAG